MDELITDFQSESKMLTGQLMEILETIEGDYSQFKRLEEVGQLVDRVQGTAKSLAVGLPELAAPLEAIGKYGELCKAVAYKGSQVANNEQLFNIVVALLLDAAEMMDEMIASVNAAEALDFKKVLSNAFVDRLKWLEKQFPSHLRASVGTGQTGGDINDILKSMGLG